MDRYETDIFNLGAYGFLGSDGVGGRGDVDD